MIGKEHIQVLRRYFVSFLFGAVLSAVLTYFYIREPNSDYDPQATSNFFCDDHQVLNTSNGGDLLFVVHVVNCDVFGNSSVTYIYLGQRGRPVTRVNLVVRYDGDAPQIRWESPNNALILIDRAWNIDKQVTKLLGVSIETKYKIVER